MLTSRRTRPSEPPHPDPVDWDAYAREYDHLLLQNPAYLEVIQSFVQALALTGVPQGAVAVDLGAGTGSLGVAMLHVRPDLRWHHVDASPAMVRAARRKLARHPVTFVDGDADALDLLALRPGLITLMHSLYTFPDPHAALRRCAQALAPGGTLLVCDLGRPMNVVKWGLYLSAVSVARQGLGRTFRLYRATAQVRAQNRAIHAAQRRGTYWLHTPAELRRAVEHAGLRVHSQRLAYRGYSDFLIATRDAAAGDEA